MVPTPFVNYVQRSLPQDGIARKRHRGQDALRSPACENRVNMCLLLPNGNQRGAVLLCIRVPKIGRSLRGIRRGRRLREMRRGHGMIRPGRRGAGTAALNREPRKHGASQTGSLSAGFHLQKLFANVQ